MSETQLVGSNNNHNSYYRSHLYTSYHGINPMVTAAHPLLSIIDRLQLSRQARTDSDFFTNLHYELKVFENRSVQFQYDEETVFISHYILSACINEKLHDDNQANTFKKLMPPQAKQSQVTDETNPDEQFFEILDKVIDKPDHYLDLLELIYICLSLGFEGKYKHEAHKRLKAITENLYQTIATKRQSKSNRLFSNHKPQPEKEIKKVPTWAWLILTGLLIGGVFLTSNLMLDKSAQSLISTEIR